MLKHLLCPGTDNVYKRKSGTSGRFLYLKTDDVITLAILLGLICNPEAN